ncbi:hypothetical protein LTR08_008527 [Meristemomyces frigidus]|nr:hypothetical protein LTR08_008527 [Meristemomyces frigidus]
MEEIWAKSQTVDGEVRAYVYSLCNAVGGSSSYDDTYAVGDDALAALNDILRWLRLYDEKLNRFDVKRCLAEANLVKGDLVEILALWPEEASDNKLKAKLALACLQLLVPLTWPSELDADKTTVNHHRHLPYLQLAQVGYKRAVLHYEHASILRTAVRIGLPSMAQPRRERTRRDEGIIKLVMYLFRNVAMITQPQMLPSQGDENEISRSSTISAFADQDVFTLLLTIGSGANDDFQDQDVILLEILFHLLKGVDAKKLFMQKEQIHHEESEDLRVLMQKEKAMLNGYNKHAPTRHNRFGTMIWVKRDEMKMSTVSGQKSIVDDSATLQQMDGSKKWNKPKYRGKMTQEFSEQSDFGMSCDLTELARKQVKGFVEDFLDSCFNPLFSSLRKAIERETERVQEMHKRQYFYLIHWFLSAETSRRSQARSTTSRDADQPPQTQPEDNTFAYIAAVLDQETFVLLNRQMQRAFDDKSWHDLQATLLCFTQILLTTQAMAASAAEEDREIAENIQNRIFYEEATHDRIVAILRGYSTQGFAYLDTVTECVHVFVRMLERYSKANADLQIRSKRRARKKQQQRQQQQQSRRRNPLDDDDDGEHSDPEEASDAREAAQAVAERRFDFARFAAKFSSQPCLQAFLTFLSHYADLTPAQLKRCHRYLYRLAFKHERAIFLFRVDVLRLLHGMVQGPAAMSADAEGYAEWEVLVRQVFRRCVRWVEREQVGWRGMCVVEMLFSKVGERVFYLEKGYEEVVERRAGRAPAELEFRGGGEEGGRVAVVVSLMGEVGKGDAVEWVKRELERAAVEREAWADGQAARGDVGGDAEVDAPPPAVFLSPDSEQRKRDLFRDKHLRLLLTTLGVQRLGTAEDVNASWIFPPEVSAEDLRGLLKGVRDAEFDPMVFEEGRGAGDLVRNRGVGREAKRGAVVFEDEEDDGEGSGGDIDEAVMLFPPNLPERGGAGGAARPAKRRRLTARNVGRELTEEEVGERLAAKGRRERERNGRIKSALFVSRSDDESDEERDAVFFRLEEERRGVMVGVIERVLEGEAAGGGEKGGKKGGKRKGAGGKGAKGKKRKVGGNAGAGGEATAGSPIVGVGVQESEDGMDLDSDAGAAQRRTVSISSDGDDDDNNDDDDAADADEVGRGTPSTSPALADDDAGEGEAIGRDERVVDSDDEDDDDAVRPQKPAVSRRRAGFIVDSSDEE